MQGDCATPQSINRTNTQATYDPAFFVASPVLSLGLAAGLVKGLPLWASASHGTLAHALTLSTNAPEGAQGLSSS